MSNLTPEQLDAVRMDANTITTAGAGTGKTHTLASLYLDMITKRKLSPTSIVALTFTEKAAAEMKGRIRAGIISRMDRDPVFWRQKYLELDRAVISTYNSFGMHILKRYAMRCGLDPFSGVLDEDGAWKLKTQTVEKCLSGLKAKKDRSFELLLGLLRFEGFEEFRNSAGLVDIVCAVMERNDMDGLRCALDRFERDWPQIRREMAADVKSIASGIEPTAKSAEGFEKVYEQIKNGECFAHNLDGIDEGFLEKLNSLLEQVGNLGRFKSGRKADLVKVLEQYRDCCMSYVYLPVARKLEQIAAMCAEQYATAKRLAGKIDFTDQIQRVYTLLSDPKNKDILKALRKEFCFFIVDEFQDTDRFQAGIINLLADSTANHANLFVVGDPKQSIYAFRGADLDAFFAFKNSIEQHGGRQKNLTLNFRSLSSITSFVNTLLMHNLDGSPEIFNPEGQLKTFRMDDGPGRVNLLYSPVFRPDLPEREAQCVSRIILDRVEKEPGLGFGDIAVLARSNSAFEPFKQAFEQAGIPFFFFRGSGFYECEEIVALASLLEFIVYPENTASLVKFLMSFIESFSPDELCVLKKRSGDFFNIEPMGKNLARIRDILAGIVRDVPFLTVDEVVVEVLSRFEIPTCVLSLPDGRARLANIMKFIEVARDFARGASTTLRDFVGFCARKCRGDTKESVAAVAAQNLDAVKFITIHSSKGLEFPVVFLVGCGKKTPETLDAFGITGHSGKTLSWMSVSGRKLFDYECAKQVISKSLQQENLRLLYVGLTRARESLYLSGETVAMGSRARLAELTPEQWAAKNAADEKSFRGMIEKYKPLDGQECVLEKISFDDILSISEVDRNQGAAKRISALVENMPEYVGARQIRAVYEHLNPSKLGNVESADKNEDANKSDDDERLSYEHADTDSAHGLVGQDGTVEALAPMPVHDYATRGTVGHRVLELAFRPDMTDEQLMCLDPEGFGVLNDEDRGFVLKSCRNFLESEFFSRRFEKVFCELSYCRKFTEGNRVVYVEGVIDRVCIDEDGMAHIFDYKFSRPKPGQYQNQMREYATAVSKAGYKVKTCCVLFLGGSKLVAEHYDVESAL